MEYLRKYEGKINNNPSRNLNHWIRQSADFPGIFLKIVSAQFGRGT